MLEENYLLLSLLTHLIFTFKIVVHKFNKEVPDNVKEFITRFEHNFETNLKGFQSFLTSIQEIPELEHLKNKLPQIPNNLFQELKTSNFGKLNRNLSDKPEFQLSDYLNVKNSILGLQIPLTFKTYVNFEQNCHEHYDILLGTQVYRQKVGEYY
jgi:hypothetical protein